MDLEVSGATERLFKDICLLIMDGSDGPSKSFESRGELKLFSETGESKIYCDAYLKLLVDVDGLKLFEGKGVSYDGDLVLGLFTLSSLRFNCCILIIESLLASSVENLLWALAFLTEGISDALETELNKFSPSTSMSLYD